MTVTTTIQPTARRFAWSGLDDPNRSLSSVPRAEVVFTGTQAVSNGDVTGQQVTLSIQIPQGFAYAVSSVSAELYSGGAAAQWNDGMLVVTDLDTPGEPIRYNWRSGVPGIVAGLGGTRQLFTPDRMTLPPFLAFADMQEPTFVTLFLYNDQASETGWNINYFVRLLEFDVSQVYSFETNTPQLIR